MDHNKQIAAASIAQRFLLTQLYMQNFFNDPQARNLMPTSLLAITQRDAEQALSAAEPDVAELIQLVHEEVEQFFTDVETRLRGIEGQTT